MAILSLGKKVDRGTGKKENGDGVFLMIVTNGILILAETHQALSIGYYRTISIAQILAPNHPIKFAYVFILQSTP